MSSFLDGEILLAKVAQKQTFSGMLVSSFYCRYNSYYVRKLDIFFSSNHNIHKSSCGLCFRASEPLVDRFY